MRLSARRRPGRKEASQPRSRVRCPVKLEEEVSPKAALADAHAVVATTLDELAVILNADERPRIAGEHDNGHRTEDGVDGAALEAELAQVENLEGDLKEIRDKAKSNDMPGVLNALSKGTRHNAKSRQLATQLGMKVCNEDED